MRNSLVLLSIFFFLLPAAEAQRTVPPQERRLVEQYLLNSGVRVIKSKVVSQEQVTMRLASFSDSRMTIRFLIGKKVWGTFEANAISARIDDRDVFLRIETNVDTATPRSLKLGLIDCVNESNSGNVFGTEWFGGKMRRMKFTIKDVLVDIYHVDADVDISTGNKCPEYPSHVFVLEGKPVALSTYSICF